MNVDKRKWENKMNKPFDKDGWTQISELDQRSSFKTVSWVPVCSEAASKEIDK